ncbi:MAG TPA: hypothetical protein VHC95_08735 [Opitutales bacterium]|nr:hypothetical protein [Opitutales bacterium]
MLERKKKADPVLNWHPNFRVVETLPDIKQVRTGFLVNFAAIVLALVALGFTVKTEVDIHNHSRDIDRLNGEIEKETSVNNKNLAASKQFVNKSKALQFSAKFFDGTLPPLDLLDAMLAARPDNILFDAVRIDPIILESGSKRIPTQRVTISGTLASESSLSLDDFVKKILANPALKTRVVDPDKNLKVENKRDATAGVFKFTLTLTLKPV